jgi:hypothetical protein
VSKIGFDELRKTPICYDLQLVKNKYHLEKLGNTHNSLLEELLKEEKEEDSKKR